jgi:hypothetical protein
VSVRTVDQRRRAELPGDLQSLVIEVDDHDMGGRIELGRQQCGQPNRASADDGYGIA